MFISKSASLGPTSIVRVEGKQRRGRSRTRWGCHSVTEQRAHRPLSSATMGMLHLSKCALEVDGARLSSVGVIHFSLRVIVKTKYQKRNA